MQEPNRLFVQKESPSFVVIVTVVVHLTNLGGNSWSQTLALRTVCVASWSVVVSLIDSSIQRR
jgi:hypothetical protein